jgi:hypothetical protein
MYEIDDQEVLAEAREKAQQLEEISRTKGSLVQFRLEDDMLVKLQAIASERHTTAGLQARQWTLEKMATELSNNAEYINKWHQTRVAAIKQDARTERSPNFQKGPFLILHVVPLSKGVVLKPAEIEKNAQALRPLRRARSYVGMFNHLGYESRTSDIPAKAYIQVFRTGEFETVRPLFEDHGIVQGTFADAEIVDAAFTGCACLGGWRVPLPFLVMITICGLSGLKISSGYRDFSTDDLALPTVEISKADQIAKANSIEPMAQTLRGVLDIFWNAGGVDESKTFDGQNNWLVLRNPSI